MTVVTAMLKELQCGNQLHVLSLLLLYIIITVVVNTVIIDISSTTSKFKYSDNVHLFCEDVNHI